MGLREIQGDLESPQVHFVVRQSCMNFLYLVRSASRFLAPFWSQTPHTRSCLPIEATWCRKVRQQVSEIECFAQSGIDAISRASLLLCSGSWNNSFLASFGLLANNLTAITSSASSLLKHCRPTIGPSCEPQSHLAIFSRRSGESFRTDYK